MLGALESLFVDESSFRRTPESSRTDGFFSSTVIVLRKRTRARARARYFFFISIAAIDQDPAKPRAATFSGFRRTPE